MQVEQQRSSPTWRCRVLGHRFVFRAAAEQMVWSCTRCAAGSSRRYSTPAEAARFSEALNVRATTDLGKRAPIVGLLPLRVWRWWRQHG